LGRGRPVPAPPVALARFLPYKTIAPFEAGEKTQAGICAAGRVSWYHYIASFFACRFSEILKITSFFLGFVEVAHSTRRAGRPASRYQAWNLWEIPNGIEIFKILPLEGEGVS
jgi:hypothetical protein